MGPCPKAALAQSMLDNIPGRAKSLIVSHNSMAGSHMLVLTDPDGPTRPTFKDTWYPKDPKRLFQRSEKIPKEVSKDPKKSQKIPKRFFLNGVRSCAFVGNVFFTKKPWGKITTMEDIAVNFVWLKPFVEAFPDRVPSGFLICDVVLMLNEFLMDKLLLPDDPNTPLTREDQVEMAKEETTRMKKLLGALRYLWRNGSSSIMPAPGFCFDDLIYHT